MGRYRPPSPPQSPYITAQGYQRLLEEQEQLWQKRREVTKALAQAAAEGDRSENAEYIYRKKELAGIDRRIRYLQKRIPALKVVKTRPDNLDQIFFGASVVLEDEQGQIDRCRIVGPDEFDQQPSNISMDSPVAKSLLGKSINEEVILKTPKSNYKTRIKAISYK